MRHHRKKPHEQPHARINETRPPHKVDTFAAGRPPAPPTASHVSPGRPAATDAELMAWWLWHCLKAQVYDDIARPADILRWMRIFDDRGPLAIAAELYNTHPEFRAVFNRPATPRRVLQ